MQQKFKDVVVPKETQRRELQSQNAKLHNELSQAKEQIRKLEKDVAYLEWERPDRYIYWKGRIVALGRQIFAKLRQCWEALKEMILNWRERRKTHPLY